MNDLGDLFKAAAEEKRKLKEQQENTQSGKALKAVQERLKANNDIGEMMEMFVEKKPKQIIKEVIVEKEVIKEVVVNKDSFQQPAPQPVDLTITGIQKKLQFLEQAIGRIASTGPGGGEVNLRYLDDVDRSTIQDGYYLKYNATSKKFDFSSVSGGGSYTLPTATDTILGGVKIGSNITINAGVISVAAPFSGNYTDLSNKPTIPAAQVNSDWSASSGLAQILNKPTLFSGSYTDLTNKPAIAVELGTAVSDETTALTTGAAKITFRMPHAMTLTSVRLSCTTAPTGAALIVNIKRSGTTIFSTKPQIDINATTSVGSAVTPVISTSALTDNAVITIDIDQIGSTIAGAGLKVWLIGTR
jgi:hypothetical protein